MTVLELRSDNLHVVSKELRAKVSASPSFFKGNAIVFSFEHMDDFDHSSLIPLIELSKELGLVSTGIRGGSPRLIEEAQKLGLAAFPKGKAKGDSEEGGAAHVVAQDSGHGENKLNTFPGANVDSSKVIDAVPAKIIATPVRSGQQVYSPGDLVVTASVSAGAELLAEGNIHVYGALRGRALAGVRGLESARIFCLSQEAELISIAGHFLIDEGLRSAHWREPAQITYDGNDVKVNKLSI